MEKILNIEEVINENAEHRLWSGFDGYKVTTDKQVIKVLINNGQNCCESWGYFNEPDDLKDMIGANLLGVKLTDTALKTEKLNKEYGSDLECGDVQFVDFETDKGVFQLAVYNSHNGYYGHSILIESEQTGKYEACL